MARWSSDGDQRLQLVGQLLLGGPVLRNDFVQRLEVGLALIEFVEALKQMSLLFVNRLLTVAKVCDDRVERFAKLLELSIAHVPARRL